jgi:hypothetical protein
MTTKCTDPKCNCRSFATGGLFAEICKKCHHWNWQHGIEAESPTPTPTVDRKGKKIQPRFEVFHAANPHVYAELVRYSKIIWGRGYRRVGISLIYERMRWEVFTTTERDEEAEPFKMSNDFRSRYARLINRQVFGGPNAFFTERALREA